MKLAFYGVDMTIDEDGKPWLIELNGSNSGFDGFVRAYGDYGIVDAIASGFAKLSGGKRVFVVSKLVNFGELPRGYLRKLAGDMIYLRGLENVQDMMKQGVVGINWARTRNDRPPKGFGTNSVDELIKRHPNFQRVYLNVADPRYVLNETYFNRPSADRSISVHDQVSGLVPITEIESDDVIWLRCPTTAYSVPLNAGILVNQEFPYDAVADDKWMTHIVLEPYLSKLMPTAIPVGHHCSSASAILRILEESRSELFIRKPLNSSQARGIELLRREDVQEYALRLQRMEQPKKGTSSQLPLELQGVPEMIEAGVLNHDLSILSELKPSKPVHCRSTGRSHYGCMRALALVRVAEGQTQVEFLGAYWRLAPVPTDGDGMQWERFVASQSQGAFCEPVSGSELAIVSSFVETLLTTYHGRLAAMPSTPLEYAEYQRNYWVDRYRTELSHLCLWQEFEGELHAAKAKVEQLQSAAELAGYLKVPTAFVTPQQALQMNLPYLFRDAYRLSISL